MSDTANTVETGGKLFSVTEAAEACSLSQKTIKRRLSEGAFPGAYKEPMSAQGGNERWLIPLADLLAAGLQPDAARRATGADVDLTDAAGNGDQYRGEVVRLRRELAEARQEAAVAKALAAERLRSLDDARLANERQHQAMLLMLNAGSSSSRAASEQLTSGTPAARGAAAAPAPPHGRTTS